MSLIHQKEQQEKLRYFRSTKMESKSAPVDLDDVMIRIREHAKSWYTIRCFL